MEIVKQLCQMVKRRGTHISPLAILHEVQYDKTTSIGALVKMERASIGKCSSIGTLSAAYDCEIGKFCSIARECYIGGASHPIEYVSTSGCFYLKNNFTGISYNETDYKWHSETKIGNDVWLGFRVIVRGGINIGDGAIVGAGSVVTKDIGPYEIWAGNPARMIRKRFTDDIIEELLKSEWWNWDDEKLMKYGYAFDNPETFIENIKEIKE